MLASQTTQRSLIALLVALLAAIAVVLVTHPLGATTANDAASASHSRFDGPTLPANLRASNFSLRDQDGRLVTLSSFHGKVVVLTFVHSLCHDACPFMVEQVRGALNELPGDGRAVPAIAVSAEPAQDTVANRRAFLAKHGMSSRMVYLNGPLPKIQRVWRDYSIQPVTPKVDHSTFVFLIDKRGYERVGFPASGLTPDGLAHDIRVLQGERG